MSTIKNVQGVSAVKAVEVTIGADELTFLKTGNGGIGAVCIPAQGPGTIIVVLSVVSRFFSGGVAWPAGATGAILCYGTPTSPILSSGFGPDLTFVGDQVGVTTANFETNGIAGVSGLDNQPVTLTDTVDAGTPAGSGILRLFITYCVFQMQGEPES